MISELIYCSNLLPFAPKMTRYSLHTWIQSSKGTKGFIIDKAYCVNQATTLACYYHTITGYQDEDIEGAIYD